MKTTIALSLALLIAATVSAQTPPEPTPQTPPPTTGTPGPEATPPESAPAVTETTTTAQVDVGVQGVDNDTGSAKFTEYREVPKGVVLPLFRLRTDAPNYTLDLSGENVGRTDQHYAFRANTAFLRITGDYNEIPHNWGEGHTLLEQTGRGTWAMSDTLQRAFQTAIEQQWAISKPSVNYAFLSQLVAPSLATANAVDIGLLRKRGFVDFDIMPEAPVSTHVTYFVESRSGTRAAGTSFGFGNVVETPEPINYRTLDLGINAEMPFTEGVLRGGLRVNTFDDILTSYTFDNPFRATDSTDPSAYTAPATGSIGGPAVGRITTPPDNSALNGTIGLIYKLPYRSRFMADVNLGRWEQNDDFIPYTTNTAITVPINASDINTLPQRSLNGKVNTSGLVLQFTSSPVKKLNLSARYRYYDFDNKTPRVTFPGYIRFDAVWQTTPRRSVPYSYKRGRFDVMGSYDLDFGSVEAGFRSETRHHTYREVERDTENVARIGGDVRATKWMTFRASYEFGNRSINGYNAEEAEDATFLTPQSPVQPETLRRYDVNARDVSRLVTDLQLTPLDGNVSININYIYNLEKYKDADFGLQHWKNNSFTAEADYAPSDRWSTYAFYSNEFLGGLQIAEQNSTGVVTYDPKNDWIANNTDHVDSIGAGLNYAFVPQKWDGRLWLRYQRANGNAELTTPVTPSNLHPQSIAALDDTKLWTTSAEVQYHVKEHIDLAFGAWIEKYTLNDAESSNLPNYTPGSFFLAPNDLDYRGNVAYIRASYHW